MHQSWGLCSSRSRWIGAKCYPSRHFAMNIWLIWPDNSEKRAQRRDLPDKYKGDKPILCMVETADVTIQRTSLTLCSFPKRPKESIVEIHQNDIKWQSPGYLDSPCCLESDLCIVVAYACVLKAKCRAAEPCTLHGPWQSLGALSYPSQEANSDINRNEMTWYMVMR